MHTMRFADELAKKSEFKLKRAERKPSKREIDMAAKLIDGLHTDFTPSRYKDKYRDAVLKVIERKASGKEIEPPDEEEPEGSDDLLAALEASMKGS
jgi:DNA end-binding protein Ku